MSKRSAGSRTRSRPALREPLVVPGFRRGARSRPGTRAGGPRLLPTRRTTLYAEGGHFYSAPPPGHFPWTRHSRDLRSGRACDDARAGVEMRRSTAWRRRGVRSEGPRYHRADVPPPSRCPEAGDAPDALRHPPGSSRRASPTHRLRGGRRLDRSPPLPQADRRGSPESGARRPGCPKG